jgi:hypothetical protein
MDGYNGPRERDLIQLGNKRARTEDPPDPAINDTDNIARLTFSLLQERTSRSPEPLSRTTCWRTRLKNPAARLKSVRGRAVDAGVGREGSQLIRTSQIIIGT